MEIVYLLAAAAIIIAGGLFVAAEFSLITVNRNEVKAAAASGDKRAAGVLQGVETLSTQLSGAQLGITLTNLGIGFIAEPAIADLLVAPLTDAGLDPVAARGVSVTLALVIATFLTMIFGEMIPKNLAIAKPLWTARKVTWFQRGFSFCTAPLLKFFNGMANGILRMMRIEPQEELASARSTAELASLATHSVKQGTLTAQTGKLLHRTVTFTERKTREVMTPRSRMAAISAESMVSDVLERVAETGFSRFPVIDAAEDSLVGVVHLRRALEVPTAERASTPVTEIVDEAAVIPESIPLDDLAGELRSEPLHCALVIDGHGSIVGLVTLEDVLEEIIGEVTDEHDPDTGRFTQVGDNAWALDGYMRPDEVAEIIGVDLPDSDDYETIGGLVTTELGRIAEVGDEVTVDDDLSVSRVVLRVMEMDQFSVVRVVAEVSR